MIDYRTKPYNLDSEALKWVEQTYQMMTLEERIGQLFCPIGYSSDPGYLTYKILDKHPGGMLFRTGQAEEMSRTYAFLQKNSKIPMFTAANLEAGGDGIVAEGTSFGKQLQVAATNDSIFAYRLGKVCAREGRAVGCNYAFAPVVDIDRNFRNPITNVRTYGSNADKVIEFAKEYMKACEEEGMLTSIKHFPGDGVDECDQHILTSVNSLSRKEWLDSYGKVYKALIDHGARTVMVGHIALPSFQSEKDCIMPATLSKDLLQGLLRERLGFNGMIISDATPMVGFCCAMERRRAVPYSIMCGIDMFLFNKDYDEDYSFMMDGYRSGLLTEERLEEAVKTILATKASMGMHKSDNFPLDNDFIGCDEHLEWAHQCADRAVTLVKDTQDLLPLDRDRHHRVLLQILGDCASNDRIVELFSNEMEKRGFYVSLYEREVFDFTKPIQFDTIGGFRAKYDLVIYLGNIENASNKTTNRINWYTLFGLGNNMPWFVKEVPTMFISLQNPYHLLDVPMIKTYINCYSNHDDMIRTVVGKILGESEFKGVSPVDPFCGKDYLRY